MHSGADTRTHTSIPMREPKQFQETRRVQLKAACAWFNKGCVGGLGRTCIQQSFCKINFCETVLLVLFVKFIALKKTALYSTSGNSRHVRSPHYNITPNKNQYLYYCISCNKAFSEHKPVLIITDLGDLSTLKYILFTC